MGDLIAILPDHVANQIAAGEVVQRPASAVKELLENAIDAGATEIKLIVKDAGKTLLQVIDNGSGMGPEDVQLAFERHATSKIRSAEDLFRIKTMGFRGEALASIAAVAQVECKTRRVHDEMATLLNIEGSRVTNQEFCQSSIGTSIAAKNLFFNIPARRQFLKSDQVEFRHIVDEFEHVALAHPEIAFELHHNNNEIFHLEEGNLRQRISGIFGKKYNERLVPVDENTDVVSIKGFVLKPEFARKTRGEQFFFVNDRYIKNSYLHHAVQHAFSELISNDEHPSYFLFMDIDPGRIDVNIHPTKTEIKFDDEKAIYAIIRSAVKHALGQFNIAPSIDFDSDVHFMAPPMAKHKNINPPAIYVDPDFNPFKDEAATTSIPHHKKSPVIDPSWRQMYEFESPEETVQISANWDDDKQHEQVDSRICFQIDHKYIASKVGGGLLLIHQHRAHRRILYDAAIKLLHKQTAPSQQLLFPVQLSFKSGDVEYVLEIHEILHRLGFEFERFGQTGLSFQGIPMHMKESELEPMLEHLIEDAKNESDIFRQHPDHAIAKSLAESTSIKTGQKLNPEEMTHLMDELFACDNPQTDYLGKPILNQLGAADIDKKFNE